MKRQLRYAFLSTLRELYNQKSLSLSKLDIELEGFIHEMPENPLEKEIFQDHSKLSTLNSTLKANANAKKQPSD